MFSVASQSQEVIKDSIDVVNRLMFKEINKLESESLSNKTRDIFIEQYSNLKENTSDSLLITMVDVKIRILELQTFDDISKKVSKEELLNVKPKKFKTKEETFNNTIFLTHKMYGLRGYNVKTYLAFYNGDLNVRLSIRYYGSDWLFITEAVLLIDGKYYNISFDGSKRKVTSQAKVTERIDVLINKTTEDILRKIVDTRSEVQMRFNGSEGRRDVTLSKKEIEAIKETLDYYDMF